MMSDLEYRKILYFFHFFHGLILKLSTKFERDKYFNYDHDEFPYFLNLIVQSMSGLRYKEKITLVSGGSRGIGKGCVEVFGRFSL